MRCFEAGVEDGLLVAEDGGGGPGVTDDASERQGRPFNAQVATRQVATRLDFDGFWDLVLSAIESV